MVPNRVSAGHAIAPALALRLACFGLGMALAGAAQAIDAARSLRPMVHIPKTPEGKESSSEPGQPKSAARSSPAGKSAQPLLPPGTVQTNTVSGKPFVAVKPNTACTVSAGAGDLEAQLRSCAGVGSAAKAVAR